ncbi:MAG: bifunctional UDP-N-acetylglucosamine diphosphorylase/glucosamine-1-phosphate N-acetyltransferase GlmU [Coriobacteriia bacterium]|nr:bifunctional UDP-N-acetylglucosamine diphosphorylase/glucosamine-1-phosphate N-acetyltransferase GlmU [Coriobacteriia bacterium]
MSVTTLILAAGDGTRMKSEKPKVMHEILGVPMLHMVIDAAKEAGADRIIVVTGHLSEEVAACACQIEGVETVLQPDRCGTANAVQLAQPLLEDEEGTLVVLAGDVPLLRPKTIRSLVEDQEGNGAAMSVLTAVFDDPFGYGRIVRDDTDHLDAIVEQKDATAEQCEIKETNAGAYAFDLDGLFEALDQIDNDNAKKEYYLTDIVKIYNDEGRKVRAFEVTDNDETLGVNDRTQLAEATAILHKRITHKWLHKGVTIVSPETTWIGPEVTIERDVEIWPNTYLRGKTHIGKGSTIGPDTRLVDVTVGEQTLIDSSIVLESEVGDFVNIGPRSYIRPGCVFETGSKVGTSCELKKAHVGPGSKVPHLAYIGDTTIGKKSNIGAGVITCNYDGYVKSKTEIGDHAFIGSDVMLVAPVKVGDGANIAAGSAISTDIPADAMAIERADLRVEEGMAKFLREMKEGS